MYKHLHLYIDFDWKKLVEDENYLTKIHQIVELAYQHKASVFYSTNQIQDFVKNCNDLDGNFSQSYGNQLQILLENASAKSNCCYLFEVCFSHENTSLNHFITVPIFDLEENNAFIFISQEAQEKHLLLIKNSIEFEKIIFFTIKNTNNLLQWINDNSTRVFNLSSKHGESGKNEWSDNKGQSVSKLLCSKEDAQQLLNTAIPDFIEKENRLFNFDETHQMFIEFFYEGAQNQWHGFHVEQTNWQLRIPQSIRKYFGKT